MKVNRIFQRRAYRIGGKIPEMRRFKDEQKWRKADPCVYGI